MGVCENNIRDDCGRSGHCLCDGSITFAIGMIGIASGSNLINSGARLKNQQRKTAAADLDGSVHRCRTIPLRNRKRRHDNDV
ncbi:MAG: hypothetical protein ACLT3Y_01765 [Ruminococcus callidus]